MLALLVASISMDLLAFDVAVNCDYYSSWIILKLPTSIGSPTASPTIRPILLDDYSELDIPLETTVDEVTVKDPMLAPEVKPDDKADVDEETVVDEIEIGVAVPEVTTEPNLIEEKVMAST